ncbi:hypothetical protein J7E24_09440 [Hymenobacter sp. ISL-91]|uniref:hypothetical protein n=1 Tax=Hymenobacter sp. ISL-91 TaxID=2819151 RepID=UPI001BE823DE|nr:hypothetical protein [Hymenobacter sp. ISL-91]MBT2558007.1 hypothetical protein [Hymenobacter sp. ISL-91]
MPDSADRFNADEEWEDLLRQLPASPAASPRPYFYSRVRARIEQQAAAERLPVRTWLHWPAYAVLLGALLLLSGDDAALQSVSAINSPPTSPEASFGGE